MKRPFQYKLSALLLGSLAALALGGCGGNLKPETSASNSHIATNSNTSGEAAALVPKDLVALAQQKKSPEREQLILQAANIYYSQNKLDKARNLVGDMNAAQLPDVALAKYSQILAGIELKEGAIEAARRILTNPRLERQLNALEPQQEAALRELRAQSFERSGQLQETIAERITASTILTDTQANSANQDALWQTLMSLPLDSLQENATKGSGGITQGWFSLAALSKNNTQDLQTQQAALSKWQSQWRNHPAASNLPKDLRLLQNLINQQPKKIALLLPLQGRLAEAGEAVHDGFFAAYYQQLGSQQALPSVREYDTSKGATAAYQEALKDGAELIIGPLDKEDVNQITKLTSLSVPLMSLNYPDQQPAQAIANFYQFGLAVEDEARQVARQAIQDGHKHALVVAPAQDVSERSAQAFINEWQKLGGTVIGKTTFGTQDKFSENFRQLMLIDESQARMTLLQQQLVTKFEFIPYRRADVDMIFMAVSPAQGRQIKPTLAFHYANNIPVYATSSIYSGEADVVNNDDLNGVLFNTLPWIFDSANPIKTVIAQNSKTSAVYGRLHALGADAFHLYARLPQLKQAPEMRLYGATGSLHLLADGRIEREQMWARFNAGLAEPLTTVVDKDTQNGD